MSWLNFLTGLFIAVFSFGGIAGQGKLLGTPGVSQVEGSAGGGLVPWAQLAGYASDDEFAINGKENFGKKGGCSYFRDSNSDEAEHMKLVERYGEHIIRPTDEFYDLKHMGKHRKFKIDCKSAYKSSQVNTLEKFL